MTILQTPTTCKSPEQVLSKLATRVCSYSPNLMVDTGQIATLLLTNVMPSLKMKAKVLIALRSSPVTLLWRVVVLHRALPKRDLAPEVVPLDNKANLSFQLAMYHLTKVLRTINLCASMKTTSHLSISCNQCQHKSLLVKMCNADPIWEIAVFLKLDSQFSLPGLNLYWVNVLPVKFGRPTVKKKISMISPLLMQYSPDVKM